ncbi:MAG: TIGR02206 family membrane protein [Solirubrobacterales bacterium]
MDLLAGAHLAALAVTAAVAAGAAWAARATPGTWIVPFTRGLALLIIGAYLVENVVVVARGNWSVERSLPLHLTDAVTIVAAFALWRPRPFAVELAYFWGLTASLQAVLTPDLDSGIPSLFFWTYFVTHSGAVVAAVFLTWGLGLAPRPGAVPRVLGATVAFTALAGVGDLLTGGNYMFLREKPEQASLLDLMGPWPWYIFGAAVLAVAMFAVLDLPFRRRRARLHG